MIATVTEKGELSFVLDMDDIDKIKTAMQEMLSAYREAPTGEQINARNSMSDCLELINKATSKL